MQIKRVQTLYSYKKKDGSLHLRGIYSVDSPGGIPDMIMEDAIAGRRTVRVLEWVEDESKKIEPELSEDVVMLDKELIVTSDNDEDSNVSVEKKKKPVAKKTESSPKRKVIRKTKT